MDNKLQEEKKDNKNKNLNYSNSKKRLLNKLNSFLNANFQYVFLFILFIVFWFSFNFILAPKYHQISVASFEVLNQKKEVFINEYKKLIDQKKTVEEFKSLDQFDLVKMNKMIPNRYSREDLFVEFTYFLMKNNFNVKNINISDPGSPSPSQSNASSRRLSVVVEDTQDNNTSRFLSTVPSDVGVWLIKAEVSNVSYFDLKYLLDIIENNLKLIDVIFLDFDPVSKIVKFDALTYYKK